MKNTNLKIAHRVVSADDRDALPGAMAMDEAQARALASLEVGEAVVFSGGDDAPLLIRIPLVKDGLSKTPPADTRIRDHMARWRASGGFDELFFPQPFCPETCATPAACEAARRLADDEYVQRTVTRTVLSTIDEAGAIDRLWEDLTAVVRARRPVTVPDVDLLRAFAGHGSDWIATRRGAQGVWTYADTAEYRDRLRALFLGRLAGPTAPADRIAAFRQSARRLDIREFEPYVACHLVCTEDPPVCLYRSAVADLVTAGRYRASWREADANDARTEGNTRAETWEVCQDAAFELVEFPDQDMTDTVKATVEATARKVCMCFEQQMLASDDRKVPRTSRRILARVMTEAGL
jgi:hypothetical protein